jgi:hypothetical protein
MSKRVAGLIAGCVLFGLADRAPAAEWGSAPSWGGAYIGLGVGAGAMKVTQTADLTPTLGYIASIDNAGDGLFGTVQAGYDIQIGSSLVAGLFVDASVGTPNPSRSSMRNSHC